MGRAKFFCAYCDAYITLSNVKGRKQHAQGKKHRQNVVMYFQRCMPAYHGSENYHDFQKVRGFSFPSLPFPSLPFPSFPFHSISFPFRSVSFRFA